MANHLAGERSPYLLAHADNPVDWYPWGEEAFEKAKREDKPIFLSVGYSTCHWCHVMAEESFENERVAELLNAHFVSVKVDREERPDVDAVYLSACAALNGSAGWPLTVLMTPAGEPFFAATYLPRENRLAQYGARDQLGLIELLNYVAEKWTRDRSSLLRTGADILRYLRRSFPDRGGADAGELTAKTAKDLQESWDKEYGGFGAAPKFPSPHKLLFLLRYAALSGDKTARKAAEHTLQQMYRGGIYDHIGGGFCRYSTDREWLAPHFEKTLYDNALLAYVYTEAWESGHMPLWRKVASETLDYVLRELCLPDGGYASGQDADSDGEEGKYYLLTPEDVASVLGADEGRHFCECYDILPEGNFHGKSIPNLLINQRWGFVPQGYAAYRERLRDYRAARCALRRDDKELSAWNGMLLMALSRAGAAFGEKRYADAARALGSWLSRKAGADEPDTMAAVCYGGEKDARFPAQLDDLAFAALGFLEQYRLDYDSALLQKAEALADAILRDFPASEGGFARNSARAEQLILRPQEVPDGALPSGNGAAAVLFDLLERLSGREKWRKAAEAQRAFLASRMNRYPAEAAFGMLALLSRVYPTQELVCAAEDIPAALALVTGRYAPALTVLLKRPQDAALTAFAPFTAACRGETGKAVFYPCSGGACRTPYSL